MGDGLHQRLARWVGAGLITADQAEAIDRFEESAEEGGAQRERRGAAAEAIGYVGAGLAFGALALLLAEWWDDVVIGGRIALAVAATLVAVTAAAALRDSDSESLRRLTSVLAAASVFGIGWTTYLVTAGVLEFSDRDVGLWVALFVFVAAGVSYLARRRVLGQLVLLAASLGVVGALLVRPAMSVDPLWIGVGYWGLGAVWLLLGLGGVLAPRRIAVVAGGAVALIALQFSGFTGYRVATLTIAVLTAVALVALAVAIRDTAVLVVGAFGLFVLVPQLTFEVFGDAIGAPATLLICGVLLVVAAVGIGRVRREHLVPDDPTDRPEVGDAGASVSPDTGARD